MRKNLQIKNFFSYLAVGLIIVGITTYYFESFLAFSSVFILITLFFQGLVLLYIYQKYNKFEPRYYLLQPLFIINGTIILRAFITYFYQVIFGGENFNLNLASTNYLTAISAFCGGIILLNLLFLVFERNIPTHQINSSFRLTHQKNGLLTLFGIYGLTWITRIVQVLQGGYYHAIKTAREFGVSLPMIGVISTFADRVVPFIWIVFAFLYFTSFSNNKKFKRFFWIALIAEFIFFLPSGSKLKILYPTLITSFVWGVFTKKSLKSILTILLIGLIFFMPFYNTYRTFANKKAKGRIANSSLFSYISKKINRKGGVFPFFLEGFIIRVDLMDNYLILTKNFPKEKFLLGESYLPIFTSYVPRVIFPNKPEQLNANEIGRTTGLVNKNDYITSPAITPWGEGYLNFGYAGVIGIFGLLGLFYFWLFWQAIIRSRRFSLIKLSFFVFALIWFLIRSSGVLLGLFGRMIQVAIVIGAAYIVIEFPVLKEKENKKD